MSTTMESAKSWIDEKSPSNEEIRSVIEKLEKRIEDWTGDEDRIQGSIEAALFLQNQLNAEPQTPDPDSAKLDTSKLIPDATPVELEQAVKNETFNALKRQLGKKL